MSMNAQSALSGLGYLVPEFPQQTHAFFWREIAALRAMGAKVVLFSTRRPPDEACPHEFGAEAREQTCYLYPPSTGTTLRFLAQHPGKLAKALRYTATLSEGTLRDKAKATALIGIAANLCQQAQKHGVRHLHIHSCASSAYIGALAQILGGPSYSLTLHGHLPVYGKNHAHKMRAAAFVSTVTIPLQADVKSLGLDIPVPVISMGVDTQAFAPTDRANPPPFTFISIARLNYVKGHIYFLQALRQLADEGHDVHYRIAGEGPYLPEITACIKQLNLEDRVTLTGPLSESQVHAELSMANAFALTSFGEGEAAPVAVMEAMATGLPVICSIIGGTQDMIEDERDGLLVHQKDVDGITNAARRLITDRDFGARIATAARARAIVQFNDGVQAAKLWDALQPSLKG